MDSMDNFRERFEALEQRTKQLKQQTQALEAQSHTSTTGSLVAGHCLWGHRPLPEWVGTPGGQCGGCRDRPCRGSQKDIAALRDTLGYITSATNDQGYPEVVITGANLRIVNSLGNTETTNGLGNPNRGL